MRAHVHRNPRKYKRPKTCGGKVRYRDHADATSHLKWISTNGTGENKPIRSYYCPSCNGYHLTKKAPDA